MRTAMSGTAHLHSLMALAPGGISMGFSSASATGIALLPQCWMKSTVSPGALWPQFVRSQEPVAWCGRSAAITHFSLFFHRFCLGDLEKVRFWILQNEMLDHLGYQKPWVDCSAPHQPLDSWDIVRYYEILFGCFAPEVLDRISEASMREALWCWWLQCIMAGLRSSVCRVVKWPCFGITVFQRLNLSHPRLFQVGAELRQSAAAWASCGCHVQRAKGQTARLWQVEHFTIGDCRVLAGLSALLEGVRHLWPGVDHVTDVPPVPFWLKYIWTHSLRCLLGVRSGRQLSWSNAPSTFKKSEGRSCRRALVIQSSMTGHISEMCESISVRKSIYTFVIVSYDPFMTAT